MSILGFPSPRIRRWATAAAMVPVLAAALGTATATAVDRCHTFAPGADLHDCDLHRADLRDARLDGANLSGANFGRAEFSRTNLTGANLTNPHVLGTGFADANLRGATIAGWKINFFTVFRGATWIGGKHCPFPPKEPATEYRRCQVVWWVCGIAVFPA